MVFTSVLYYYMQIVIFSSLFAKKSEYFLGSSTVCARTEQKIEEN